LQFINKAKVLDAIIPGLVNWSKVNQPKGANHSLNAYQSIENCNYCVELGKQLKFSMINIGGNDIYVGNKKLVLGLIWQIMRLHMFTIISDLNKNLREQGKKELTEADIIQWANEKVAESGKSTRMTSFKDPTLKDARFLLDLIGAIRPGRVDYSLVMEGKTGKVYESSYIESLSLFFQLTTTNYSGLQPILIT
jgi:plastin-1